MIQLDNSAFAHADDPGETGYTPHTRRISVTAQEAAILQALMVNRRVLEIGTGLGVSTAAMAKAAQHVYTCDVDVWVKNAIVPKLTKRITFVERETVESIGGIRGARLLSAAFIDGLHTEAAVLEDIRLVCGVICKGSPIVFHDTKMDSVKAAIQGAKLRLVYEFDTHYGLGVYVSRE